MKKIILTLLIVLFCIIGADSRQVEAYSVNVQKDGIYAEVIPDSLINNTAAIFKKNVKKAMKYYYKYEDAFKDEDFYTLATKVPDLYRDFIPVAKQIQDTDKIIIRNPFYIYYPGDDAEICEHYWFFVEKNGKKLCTFRIDTEPETGEISFWYDKMEDSHFAYDEETVRETLFYVIDETIYAETPDKISEVWDRKVATDGEKMVAVDETTDVEAEWKAVNQKFKKKSYHEKKDEILAYLAKMKKGKSFEKIEKNIELELEDEYVEPEKNAKESGRTGIYIVIGIVVTGVITGGIILIKKRN